MSKRKPERFPLRIQKGAFVPADLATQARLRDLKFKTGDIVFAEFRKPRNPRFHRLAHALGNLCAENIEAFAGVPAHRVLKRLQLESGIGCDEMAINVPGVGKCLHLTPLSMSYESMDEAQFYEVIQGFCRYLSEHYWPDLTPDQIENMAGVMINE